MTHPEFHAIGILPDEELLAAGWTLIKHNASRSVWKGIIGDQPALLKRHRARGFIGNIRHAMGHSRAMKEWENSRTLKNCGVPVARPLAAGTVTRSGGPREGFYLCEYLGDFEPLSAVAKSPNLFGRERTKLIDGLALFVRLLHDRGVIHCDFHSDNILVRRDPSGYRFRLVDLHSIRKLPVLSPRQCHRNLAELNKSFNHLGRGHDRLRFLKIYLGIGSGTQKRVTVHRIAQAIHRRTQSRLRQLWRHKGRRWRRENSRTTPLKAGLYKGFARREFLERPGIRDWLTEPQPLLFPHTILKDSRTTTVLSVDHPDGAFIVKKYKRKSLLHPLRYLFRRSRTMRTWRIGNACNDRNLPVPLVLAAMEQKRLGWLTDQYVVMERAAGEDLWSIHEKTSHAVRKRALHTLARTIRIMHQRGVDHRDLKSSNIIVQRNGASSSGRLSFTILDFDSVRVARQVSLRRRFRSLIEVLKRFHIGPLRLQRTDRLRFIKSYLGRTQWNRVWKDFWRVIDGFTSPLLDGKRMGNGLSSLRFACTPSDWKPVHEIGLGSLSSILDYSAGVEVDRNSYRSVRTVDTGDPQRRWFLKRHINTQLKTTFQSMFQVGGFRSQGLIEWRRAHELDLAGIPTGRAVAAGDRCIVGVERESFYISEEIANAKPLSARVDEFPQGSMQQHTLIRKLSKWCQHLHAKGFHAPDLYLKHLYLADAPNAPIILIDLHRITRHRGHTPRRLMTRDLGALSFSTPDQMASTRDRLRFFRLYLNKSKGTRLTPSERRWVRDIKKRHDKLRIRRRPKKKQVGP